MVFWPSTQKCAPSCPARLMHAPLCSVPLNAMASYAPWCILHCPPPTRESVGRFLSGRWQRPV
eukprot:15431708-Alexandrium_andersonii.AAC.1